MTYSIEWLQLITRVMADDFVESPDAGYLVGQTTDNAVSVLRRGADLWGRRMVPMVAIQKGGEGFGYCGYEYSMKRLLAYGVPSGCITPVQFLPEFEATKQVNTLTELIGLARMAKELSWRSIDLIAPQFHQLRAYITMVTALDHEYPELKVYNCVGWPLPWKENVTHSQGTTTGTRAEIFVGEIERIQLYQKDSEPFPLVSVERALEYLDQRDV